MRASVFPISHRSRRNTAGNPCPDYLKFFKEQSGLFGEIVVVGSPIRLVSDDAFR